MPVRPRTIVLLATAGLLLLPLTANAQGNGGQPTYQVSGGGQIIADTNGFTGPGTTIAFVAQGQGPSGDLSPRGQLQIVERNGAGPPTRKIHGLVDCIIPDFVFDPGGPDEVEGVRFGGEIRDGDGDGRFLVDVVDNGQPSEGTDMIAFTTTDEEDCDNGDEPPEGLLGRGNVKIHDRRPS